MRIFHSNEISVRDPDLYHLAKFAKELISSQANRRVVSNSIETYDSGMCS